MLTTLGCGARRCHNWIVRRHSRLIAAVLCFGFAASACFAQDGPSLLDALRTAVQTGDRTGFATLLDGASIAAMAYVNTKIIVMRRDLATDYSLGLVDPPTFNDQYERLTEMVNDLERRKNSSCPAEPDHGSDPFYARFVSNVPLNPLPPFMSLTLDSGTGASEWVNPPSWGGGVSSPSLVSGNIAVDFTQPGRVAFQTFSMTLGNFSAGGATTVFYTVRLLAGRNTGSFILGQQLSSSVREFEAHFEGAIENNIYPGNNPIAFLSDVQGFLDASTNKVWITSSEPLIAPGSPGGQNVLGVPRLDFGSRISYDSGAHSLSIADNVDGSQGPGVTVVRYRDGTYEAETPFTEPALDAHLVVQALPYLGTTDGNLFRFGNAAFSVVGPQGTYLSGTLTNVKIDAAACEFSAIAQLAFGSPPPSRAVGELRSCSFVVATIMGPVPTADLLAGTSQFTTSYTSDSQWFALQGGSSGFTVTPAGRPIWFALVLIVCGVLSIRATGRFRTANRT